MIIDDALNTSIEQCKEAIHDPIYFKDGKGLKVVRRN